MEFILQEADSTEMLLEDGSGSILMETSTDGVAIFYVTA